MENKDFKQLSKEELMSIEGGNIFVDAWNWLKKHFYPKTDGEPGFGVRF